MNGVQHAHNTVHKPYNPWPNPWCVMWCLVLYTLSARSLRMRVIVGQRLARAFYH